MIWFIFYYIACMSLAIYVFVKKVAQEQGYVDVWDVLFLILITVLSPALAPPMLFLYVFDEYEIGDIKIWEKK